MTTRRDRGNLRSVVAAILLLSSLVVHIQSCGVNGTWKVVEQDRNRHAVTTFEFGTPNGAEQRIQLSKRERCCDSTREFSWTASAGGTYRLQLASCTRSSRGGLCSDLDCLPVTTQGTFNFSSDCGTLTVTLNGTVLQLSPTDHAVKSCSTHNARRRKVVGIVFGSIFGVLGVASCLLCCLAVIGHIVVTSRRQPTYSSLS